MKNPFVAKEWTVGRIVLVLWVVFSLVYVGLGVKDKYLDAQNAYQYGQQVGKDAAVAQIVGMAKECTPISLYAPVDGKRVDVSLIDPTCAEKAAQTTTPKETTKEE